MLPIFFTFIAFIGVSCTSAGQQLYGTVDWDPSVLISNWDNRAARFFAAFSFALAALGVNISANSLSAANDLSALMPTYINLRRGQLACAVISFAIVPWKILASAGSFLNFMSAYSVFLGPIASILVLDFWIVKKRKYDVVALFDAHGIYWYWHGINLRAVLAFVVGIAPNMPGFIYNVNPSIDPGAGIRPYSFAWLLGFVATGITYVVVSWLFPARESYIERAVLPDEIYLHQNVLVGTNGEVGSQDEEASEGSDVKRRKPHWSEKFL